MVALDLKILLITVKIFQSTAYKILDGASWFEKGSQCGTSTGFKSSPIVCELMKKLPDFSLDLLPQ